MMLRRLVTLLSVVGCLWLTACNSRPEYVMDEESLTNLLVDIHQAEGLLEIQDNAVLHPAENEQYQKEVMAAVLQRHHVSREQYDSTLMWYAQHLKLFSRLYGHVEERLQEKSDYWSMQVNEARDFLTSAAGDSVELWTLRQHLILDATLATGSRYWSIPADSNFLAGDTVQLAFTVRYLQKKTHLLAALSLSSTPQNNSRNKNKESVSPDIVCAASSLIDSCGSYSLTVAPPIEQRFSSVQVSLFLLNDTSTAACPTFIDHLSLLRLHVSPHKP